jgi:hypothetical protein
MVRNKRKPKVKAGPPALSCGQLLSSYRDKQQSFGYTRAQRQQDCHTEEIGSDDENVSYAMSRVSLVCCDWDLVGNSEAGVVDVNSRFLLSTTL